MNEAFKQWLLANGYDPEALAKPENAKQLKHLEAAWKAETTPANPTSAPFVPTPQPTPTSNADTSFDEKMKAIEDENERQSTIRELTIRAVESNVGNTDKCKQLRSLGEAAIADKKVTLGEFKLQLIRASNMLGPMVTAPKPVEVTADVIEAAVCATHRLANLEKRYDEKTLDAAHRRFGRGITLGDLLVMAAQQNGYRGHFSKGNLEAICRYAFRRPQHDGEMYAGSPLSTISIPGILSNVANKFLAAQFLYTEQSWRRVAKIATATDFKEMSTYRLTGNNKFKKVPPGGEIKHGTLSELKYTNQVDTWGIMLGLDRRDFINDDMGALTGTSGEIGRGAGDALNEVVWTEWLDDATFFPTDKSNANYDDGAVDSLLSLAGLENADAIFGLQTKPDGTPLGAMPVILLVPRTLRARGRNLMANESTAAAQATVLETVKNPWAGMFEVVDSVYLQSSAIPGSSATAWYLLADPNNIAAIEIAFLFGKDSPTVEFQEFDFDRLGLSTRAYMDFGCKKQEFRAGVKMKGAA
jgi:hypothetical protein